MLVITETSVADIERALVEAWWSLWTVAVGVDVFDTDDCYLRKDSMRAAWPMFDATGQGRLLMRGLKTTEES